MPSKSEIRQAVLQQRDLLSLETRLEAALNLQNHWPLTLNPAILAGFLPIKSEIDVRPLMQFLKAKGTRLCLPVITSEKLIFRELNATTTLIQGTFGTLWPDETAQELTPDTILLPLAAFDAAGNRIGYGQGHYDKTLAHLNAIKIGAGFACQEVPAIQAEPHDVRLDYILTQKAFIKVDNSY